MGRADAARVHVLVRVCACVCMLLPGVGIAVSVLGQVVCWGEGQGDGAPAGHLPATGASRRTYEVPM